MSRRTWTCPNWHLVSLILTPHRIDLRSLGEIGDGKRGSGLPALVIGAVVRNGKVYLEILSRNMGVITRLWVILHAGKDRTAGLSRL